MKKYLTLEQCQEAKQFLAEIDASMEYIQYEDLEIKYYKDPGTWVYSEVIMAPKNTDPRNTDPKISKSYRGKKIVLSPCWSLNDLIEALDFRGIVYRVEFDGKMYIVKSGMCMFEGVELIDCIYNLIEEKWQNQNL